jgi:hypothetical protein
MRSGLDGRSPLSLEPLGITSCFTGSLGLAPGTVTLGIGAVVSVMVKKRNADPRPSGPHFRQTQFKV